MDRIFAANQVGKIEHLDRQAVDIDSYDLNEFRAQVIEAGFEFADCLVGRQKDVLRGIVLKDG
ncbi:hypothetical protein D3C83_292110 [compost metagenome]